LQSCFDLVSKRRTFLVLKRYFDMILLRFIRKNLRSIHDQEVRLKDPSSINHVAYLSTSGTTLGSGSSMYNVDELREALKDKADLSRPVLESLDRQYEALTGRLKERRAEINVLKERVMKTEKEMNSDNAQWEAARLNLAGEALSLNTLKHSLNTAENELRTLNEEIAMAKAVVGEYGEEGFAAIEQEKVNIEGQLQDMQAKMTQTNEDKALLMSDMEAQYKLAVSGSQEANRRVKSIERQQGEAQVRWKRTRSQIKQIDAQLKESTNRKQALENVLKQCQQTLTIATESVQKSDEDHARELANLAEQEQDMLARNRRAKARHESLIAQLNHMRTEMSSRSRALDEKFDDTFLAPAETEMAAAEFVAATGAAWVVSETDLERLQQESDRVQGQAQRQINDVMLQNTRNVLSNMDGSESESGSRSSSHIIGTPGRTIDLSAALEKENLHLRAQKAMDLVYNTSQRPVASLPPRLNIKRSAKNASVRKAPLVTSKPASNKDEEEKRGPLGKTRRKARTPITSRLRKTTSEDTPSVDRRHSKNVTSSDSGSNSSLDTTPLSLSLSPLDRTYESASTALELSVTSTEDQQVDADILALASKISNRLSQRVADM